jgi:hypothetical protein
MADDTKARTTSFAKEVDGLVQQENALDRALALKEQFKQAQNQHQQSPQVEKAKGDAQQGSQMVKSDAPALRPTPKGLMRDRPDEQSFDARLEKERAAEDQKLENARKAQEAYNSRQHNGPDRDRDR